MKGIVVAAASTGSGKTSLTLGLLTALRRRGLTVQPFKAGPDFIDPGLHALAAGRESHNLDSWLLPRSGVQDIFARACQPQGGQSPGVAPDIAVVEGVMGLFDGFSPTSEAGSTAELAKLLDLPVLLLVDAGAMARSLAALVKGFLEFDPQLSFAGVVVNRAKSPRHARLLAEALEQLPGVRLWGVLPQQSDVALPGRHLGLVTADDGPLTPERLEALADWVEASLDLDALLASLPHVAVPPAPPVAASVPVRGLRPRIGVARDAAFCFYYQENFRLLQQAGAELVFFSPLDDARLPKNLHGLYLGGGYPELHAADLAQNSGLRREVAALCASGRPVLAECGGFMYLMDGLILDQQTPSGRGYPQFFPMAGVFPFRATMNARRAALGYRQVETTADSPLGPAGTLARGHEFHYSSIPEAAYASASLYRVADREGPLPRTDGFVRGRVVGSYIHLHLGSSPNLARSFVEACAAAVGS